MQGLSLQQRQAQVQILSQRQIQALTLLSLGAEDLREAVYKEVEQNPALEITGDRLAAGADIRPSAGPRDYTRLSSSVGGAAQDASDRFQDALEAKADTRVSLQEHLLRQFHLLDLPPVEQEVGDKLIHNLTGKGFHILAPVSLLDASDSRQTEAVLARCMDIIQRLDPPGTCTANTEESLYVQARQQPDAPALALFLLDGHLAFLNPPLAGKVAKKVAAWQAEQKKLFASSEKILAYTRLPATPALAEEAISFIRTLDPYPARDYGGTETHYIAPDIFVKEASPADTDNFEQGIVTAGGRTWQITLAAGSIPRVAVSSAFMAGAAEATPQEQKLIQGSIRQAEGFLETLRFRQSTIARAACAIVKHQHAFFEQGPGHLVPLRQQDVAAVLDVHESTISRMANGKYLQCSWGLFEVKYFFTNAVTRMQPARAHGGASATEISRDAIMHQMQAILEEHRDDKKKLSDQKLCDLLAERGIPIARRTVAKYRSQMNIDSSYTRE